MTDLIDEVKASFERSKEEVEDRGPVQVMRGEDDLVPGFSEMREHYSEVVLVIARRGYRHHAGVALTHNADELIELTSGVMVEPLARTLLAVFSDGVLVGQQTEQIVKMCFHFNAVEHLFHDPNFRKASDLMSSGFAEDAEVHQYFVTYITGGLRHMTHVTGFAHSQVDPGKVWDLWLLTGTACLGAAYLAGHRMGTSWREQDVLDGIEIVTEESRGSEGQDDSGS